MSAFAATDPGSQWEARLVRAAHPVVATVVDHLLARRAVCRVPGLGLLVADPAVVRAVLADTEHYVRNGRGSPGELWTPLLGEHVLLNLEGQEHRALRFALADLFSPCVVEAVCDTAIDPLLDAARQLLLAGREVDLVQLARDVSSATICHVVGLDPSAHRSLMEASDEIESMVTWRTRSLGGLDVATARPNLGRVQDAAEAAYLAGARETVMGRLNSRGLGVEQTRLLAAALFLAGASTVSSALPRIAGQLADLGWLAPRPTDAEPVDVTAVVVEGLRMTTPSLATLRRCASATTLAGHRLHRNDRVVLMLWWATRLEGGFAPGREIPADLEDLWFGAGSHVCLGAPLAMAELHRMTAMLLALAGERGLRVVSRRPARRVQVPRYASLVVRAG